MLILETNPQISGSVLQIPQVHACTERTASTLKKQHCNRVTAVFIAACLLGNLREGCSSSKIIAESTTTSTTSNPLSGKLVFSWTLAFWPAGSVDPLNPNTSAADDIYDDRDLATTFYEDRDLATTFYEDDRLSPSVYIYICMHTSIHIMYVSIKLYMYTYRYLLISFLYVYISKYIYMSICMHGHMTYLCGSLGTLRAFLE